MINLIPHEHTKRVERVYVTRLISVCLMMLSGIAFLGALLLIPSYFLALSKKYAAETELAALRQGETFALAEELKRNTSGVNEKIAIFPKTPVLSPMSTKILSVVAKEKPSGITLSAIRVVTREEKKRTVELAGTAINRDALLAFSKKLETIPGFTEVTLPVSSFARGSNITFSITFTEQ